MRGHIRKRSPGSWTIAVNLGIDPATGKHRQKWSSKNGTKREADEELTKPGVEVEKVANLDSWLADG